MRALGAVVRGLPHGEDRNAPTDRDQRCFRAEDESQPESGKRGNGDYGTATSDLSRFPLACRIDDNRRRMLLVDTVLYGLLAGLSALAVTSVLVVLRGGHRRLNGVVFAVGFVAAQFLVCGLALAIGAETVPTRGDAHDTFLGIIDILIGLGCCAAARRVRISPRSGEFPRRRFASVDAKRRAMLDRLSALRPAALAGSGALLGVGGPKRLVVTLLATASIAAAHVSTTGEVGLVGLYAALATVLVWLPVVLTVLWGQRAAEWTAAARDWCVAHRARVMFFSLVLLGVYFIVVGIVHLA